MVVSYATLRDRTKCTIKQMAPTMSLRRLARVTRLCSSKVTHNRNRIWRSASVGQHHHPRRRRANLSFHGGGSQWGTDENVGPRFGAGQNSRFRHPAVDHSSRANPGNFSRVPKAFGRLVLLGAVFAALRNLNDAAGKRHSNTHVV